MFEEKFIIAENPVSMPGPGLVIGVQDPYFVAKVVQFKTEEEMDSFVCGAGNINFFGKCDGYMIGVLVFMNLKVPQYKMIPNDFYLEEMAEFYLQNKILKNDRHYQKYKD